MESLQDIHKRHSGRLVNKWRHYLEIYDQFLPPYRKQDVIILEFGVAHGGSLQLWRNYFGPSAKIFGVDVNPECKKFEEGNTKVIIGSQEDANFLTELKSMIPPVDILIDDGGHTMKQQIMTFNHLFDQVKDGGLYFCEDTHTSYWDDYYGGLRKKGTFIEFAKNFIDDIHGWHFKKNGKPYVTDITRNVRGLHFYDSMVIIEKQKMNKPENTAVGEETLSHHIADFGHRKTLIKTIKKIAKRK